MGIFDILRGKKNNDSDQPEQQEQKGTVIYRAPERTQAEALAELNRELNRPDVDPAIASERKSLRGASGDAERELRKIDSEEGPNPMGVVGPTIGYKDGSWSFKLFGGSTPKGAEERERMSEIYDRTQILDKIEAMGKGATVAEFDAFEKDYGGGIDNYAEFREVGGTMKEFNQLKEQMKREHGEDSVFWLNMSDYVEAKKEGKPLDGVISESGKQYAETMKEQKEADAAEKSEAAKGEGEKAASNSAAPADRSEDVAAAQEAAAKSGAVREFAQTGTQQRGSEVTDGTLVADGNSSLAKTQSAEVGGPGTPA